MYSVTDELDDRREKRVATHRVLCPKLRSAVGHAKAVMVNIRAVKLGFEIDGSLNEVCAARLAKEAVAQSQIV